MPRAEKMFFIQEDMPPLTAGSRVKILKLSDGDAFKEYAKVLENRVYSLGKDGKWYMESPIVLDSWGLRKEVGFIFLEFKWEKA
jgi:hypothetical protein